MGSADDRVAELLDRWLASIELHARYLDLDDAAYARVQDWPRHQRPTRWIVDLARARCLDLKRLLAERASRGDTGFADALELMAFLTNLLGAEHVERFIPLAVPRSGTAAAEPRPAQPVPTPDAPPAAARTGQKSRSASNGRGHARVVQVPERQVSPAPPVRRPSTPAVVAPDGAASAPAREPVAATVIADAIRLLNWGREWPQLAGLISRLADRPSEQEVWTILRRHRAEIEAQASRKPG
jgi:hypothetical protein